ncbi:hypothetical protein [Gracilimonas sediminicola]|uniref:hypothetical protein n=1 Tax=Gracilimonas sediminicola TaxID=2952158 RepID=UPI0038D412E0
MVHSRSFIVFLCGLFFFTSCKKDPAGPGTVKAFGLESPFYTFPPSHSFYYGTLLWPEDGTAFWYGGHGLYGISVPDGNATNTDNQPGYYAAYEPDSETIYYLPTSCLSGCSAPVYKVNIDGGTPERIPDLEIQVSGGSPVIPVSSNQFLFVKLDPLSSVLSTYLYDQASGDSTRLAEGIPETLSPNRSEVLVYQPDETVHTEEEDIYQLAFVSLDGMINDTWQLYSNSSTHLPLYPPLWDLNGIRILYMKRDFDNNARVSLWLNHYPDSQEEKLWETSGGPEKTIEGPFRWSDDNTRLAFWERTCLEATLYSCDGGYQWTLWVYDTMKGEATKQVVDNSDETNIARDQRFSSDGSQLLFLYDRSLYLKDVN